MKKIPTLFIRDAENMSRVTREVHADCQWVIDGKGVATRKWNGTAMMLRNGAWYSRRMVRDGKRIPDKFEQVDFDENTKKAFGWVPADESSGYWGAFQEALVGLADCPAPGTYELCGPKIQGNPDRFPRHVLLVHGNITLAAPRTYDTLAIWLKDQTIEGLVFHHPDGRTAKIKRRDFGYSPHD